eukprot:m.41086 g.41086  ORF g.41086 m.41086 type:complete len:342 (-) comp12805_c0_seq1:58-1083(-)
MMHRFSGKRAAKEATTAGEAEYYARKPKAPCSAYAFFMSEQRGRIRIEHPNSTSRDITRFVAADWRAASAELKAEYQGKADRDRIRHDEEYRAWVASRPDDIQESMVAKRNKTTRGAAHGTKAAEPEPEPKPVRSTRSRTTRATPSERGTTHQVVHNTERQPARQDVFASTSTVTSSDLFCGLCQQGFATAQQKQEHLHGRKHKQTLLEQGHPDVPVKVFTDEFINYQHSRERMVRGFRIESKELKEENQQMQAQIQELKVVLSQLQTETTKLQKSNEELGFHLGTIINALQRQFAAQLPRVTNTGDVDAFLAKLVEVVSTSPAQQRDQIRAVLASAIEAS